MLEELHDGRHLGPEPLSTANCPYLGTHFCHTLCDRGDFLPDDCTIECQYCEEEDACPCNCKSLPWKFTIDDHDYLLIDPHLSIYVTIMRFRKVYNYDAPIVHLPEYGIIAFSLK